MILRPYQQKLVDDIRVAFRSGHKRVIAESPTGSGKTAIGSFMLKQTVARGKRVLFIVHRDYLLTQSSDAFNKINLDHGLIAPHFKMNYELAQIASVQTLIRRLKKIHPPDLIVIDEAHRTMGNTYLKLLSHWPNAFVVGLTATPQRLDRKPLGQVYDEIIPGPTMRWLIDHGHLCDYRAFVPPQTFSLEGLKTKFGDYDATEVSARVNRSQVTGSAIDHYNRLLGGKRAVVFSTTIQHSLDVTASFNAAGISAEHIDGTTEFNERRRMIARFASGETKILSNVDLVSEGFDLPAVEGVIMLRPTKSLVKYIQSVGRALRPSPGKSHAIILDHVGNIKEHGLPDQLREWSLEAPKRNAKVERTATRNCPNCFAIHLIAPVCPQCGHSYVSAGRSEIEHVDGELKEFTHADAEALKKYKRKRVAEARTFEEIDEVRKEFGYSAGWSHHRMKAINLVNRYRKK